MALAQLNSNFGAEGSYTNYAADLIKQFENAQLASGAEATCSPCSDSLPDGLQLGYGYDMTKKSRTPEQVQTEINGVAPDAVTGANVQVLRDWFAKGDADRADARDQVVKDLANIQLTEAEAKQLMITLMPTYERLLDGRVNSAYPDGMPESKERAALLSMTYNNPSLIGNGLQTALKAGNRANGWYEIRFRSNSQRSRGIDNRRAHEAETFGFFEGGRSTAQTAEEAKQLQNFVADNWSFINESYAAQVEGYQDKILDELRSCIAPGLGVAPSDVKLGERA